MEVFKWIMGNLMTGALVLAAAFLVLFTATLLEKSRYLSAAFVIVGVVFATGFCSRCAMGL